MEPNTGVDDSAKKTATATRLRTSAQAVSQITVFRSFATASITMFVTHCHEATREPPIPVPGPARELNLPMVRPTRRGTAQ